MYQIIIKNGIVIDPANRFHGQADVAVAEGKIAGIGQYSNDAVMVVDASDGSPKEGAVCKGALRSGARPHGQHLQDGRGHERAGPARGAPRPRLPVAAGRSGAAQRAHHPAGQPQQGSAYLPLRHGIHLRRLPLADGGK